MSSPVLILFWGGVVAVDSTAVGQAMISRPLVAGFVTGALLGVPELGLSVGAFLEMFALVGVPVGTVRLPEFGLATVIAVSVAARLPLIGQLPLSIGYGLLAAGVAGVSVVGLRRWSGARWGRLLDEGITARGISGLHWSAVVAGFLRGVVLVGLLIPFGVWALAEVSASWPLSEASTRGLFFLAAAVHGGVLVKNWGGWGSKKNWILVGTVAGLTIGIWL